MKKLFLITIIAFGLNACKFEDASVGAADSVVGKYTIKTLKDAKNTFNFPYTTGGVTLSGTVDVIKLNASQVDLKLNLEQKSNSGVQNSTQNESKIDIKKSGNTYNLETNGKSLGTLKGTTLTLDFIINKETNTVIAEKN